MNNKELLDAVCPTINVVGSAFYFIPETMALGKELGLGGMEFYIQGRGGQMGNTDSSAIAAAFGYFSPALIKSVWDAACDKCDPRKAGAAHLEAAANLGRAKLASLPGLDAFVAAMEKVNSAANPEGLALYAAIRSETPATDAAGRAMQLLAILREFRGSAHLVALRAVGIDGKKAHASKRPDMWKTFGYSEDEMPEIDDAFLAQMAEAEKITDLIVEPAYAVLNDVERAALVAGVKAAKEALAS